MSFEERRLFRLKHYHAEVKRAGEFVFRQLTSHTSDNSPEDYFNAMAQIRRIVYPQLTGSLRMQRSLCRLIKAPDSKPGN